MLCEACKRSKTKILETRSHRDPDEDFQYVLRRHRCYSCEHVFWAIEVPIEVWVEQTKGEFNVEY